MISPIQFYVYTEIFVYPFLTTKFSLLQSKGARSSNMHTPRIAQRDVLAQYWLLRRGAQSSAFEVRARVKVTFLFLNIQLYKISD